MTRYTQCSSLPECTLTNIETERSTQASNSHGSFPTGGLSPPQRVSPVALVRILSQNSNGKFFRASHKAAWKPTLRRT